MRPSTHKSKNKKTQIKNFILELDIYLAILAAVVLTVSSVFNLESRSLIYSLILSSLIVVLVALIGIRSRIEKLSSEFNKQTDNSFSSTLPDDFEIHLRNCAEVWIIGIHQHEFFTAYRNRIIDIGRDSSSRIRVLLVTPDGVASEMTAMRFANDPPPVQSERQKIVDSLHDLINLKKEASCDFQIRTIDFLLPYGAILIDRHKADRTKMYIERYTFRVRGGPSKPKMVYLPTSNWYDLFDREIQEFWKAGKPI